MKQLVEDIIGRPVAQNTVIAISGAAKAFVGEIVEEALDCIERTEEGEAVGPIEPRHIREAFRRLRRAQNAPKRVCTELYIR